MGKDKNGSRLSGMRPGFLIMVGLVVLGLILQVLFGEIVWSALRFPVNVIVLALGGVAIVVMYALRRRVPFFEWMMHNGAAVPALVCTLLLTIVMGLTVQGPSGMPWVGNMLRFWPFVLSWGWVVAVASIAGLNHLLRWKLREIPFVLNHCGVALAVIAATFGAPDKQDLLLRAYESIPEWRAVDQNRSLQELDFSITLHKFIMETYPDGSPKRFASEITVAPLSGTGAVDGTVDVNKPLKYGGWKIYQYDYDAEAGAKSQYSVFELVRDPWLWAVYAGIFMMIAGALCLMLFMAPKPVREDERRSQNQRRKSL